MRLRPDPNLSLSEERSREPKVSDGSGATPAIATMLAVPFAACQKVVLLSGRGPSNSELSLDELV
jgi:hypothetical protein